MDWRKREKKKKAALKLQEKKIETKGNQVKVMHRKEYEIRSKVKINHAGINC